MGILVECPACRIRGGLKRKLCKCGHNVQNVKIVTALKINLAVVEKIFARNRTNVTGLSITLVVNAGERESVPVS